MKKTILLLALWLVGVCAFAQETDQQDDTLFILPEYETVEITVNGNRKTIFLEHTTVEILEIQEDLLDDEVEALKLVVDYYDTLPIKSPREFLDYEKFLVMDQIVEILTYNQFKALNEDVIEKVSDENEVEIEVKPSTTTLSSDSVTFTVNECSRTMLLDYSKKEQMVAFDGLSKRDQKMLTKFVTLYDALPIISSRVVSNYEKMLAIEKIFDCLTEEQKELGDEILLGRTKKKKKK